MTAKDMIRVRRSVDEHALSLMDRLRLAAAQWRELKLINAGWGTEDECALNAALLAVTEADEATDLESMALRSPGVTATDLALADLNRRAPIEAEILRRKESS